MKNRSLLYQLLEATDPKERLSARLRKRRQRDRESTAKTSSPFNMVLIVKNKMNGEILIIDKESYTPKYHEIIVAPEKINQAIIKDTLDDPNFVQTETSKRLFGDVKSDKSSSTKKKSSDESGGDGSGDDGSGGDESGGDEESSVASAPMPKPEIPFTQSNVASGPTIALGMMGGMKTSDLLRAGLTPEQIEEYNSSDQIQQASMKIAQDISFYFKQLVGRDISEYTPNLIKEQLFVTSDFWKNMGGTDSAPKTEIVFRHKCIDESTKNKDKKCAETMCGCTDAGVIPSEQMMTVTMKYGPSSITSGRINNQSLSTLYATIAFIDIMASGGNPTEILNQFDEKERDALKKLKEDINFIKKIASTYVQDKLISNTDTSDTASKLEKIDKLALNIHQKIERIINSNILYKEMFLHEAMTGYFQFGPQSPARSKAIVAVIPDEYTVAMDEIDLLYVKKIITIDPKFVVNMKSQIDESPDELAELEACKIRNGGKCNRIFDPKKFAIRNLINASLQMQEKVYFKHSALKHLVEQEEMEGTPEEQFKALIENASGLMDLMNIFAVKPDQITIGQVDFFNITSTTFSAERNIIKVNGKTFKIPVQMDPIQVTNTEQITEDLDDPTGKNTTTALPHKKLIKKPRNYKKEQKYESTPEQKARRAARGRSRYKLAKLKLVRKGDKRDVDHKNKNTDDATVGNLQIMSASKNRAKH